MYSLPDPPQQSQWATVSLEPGQEDRDNETRYIAARAAALKLYQTLSDENWDEAWELLSAETQSFLAYVSPEGDGKAVLRSKEMKFPEGDKVAIDPVELFLIRDLRTLEDDREGEAQAETANRKEIFAISTEGKSKKIVLIYEGGAWRIHRTKAF